MKRFLLSALIACTLLVSVRLPVEATYLPPLKSVQTGTISIGGAATSNTATITSVNTGSALLVWGGVTTNNAGGADYNTVGTRITLTNATTVTATRNTASANTTTVAFTVLEYNPFVVKSLQYGTVNSTTTITSVDTTKSIISYLGNSSTEAGTTQAMNQDLMSVVLTNATTVTASPTSFTASFAVLEFK